MVKISELSIGCEFVCGSVHFFRRGYYDGAIWCILASDCPDDGSFVLYDHSRMFPFHPDFMVEPVVG